MTNITTHKSLFILLLLSIPFLGFSSEKSILKTDNFSSASLNLFLSISGTEPSCATCSDGAVNVSPIGGIPPYTFQWSNGETTQSINNLPSGSYSVTVSDLLNCQTTESITIQSTAPTSFTVEVFTLGVGCFGGNTGNAVVQATGGTSPYQFSWSTGDTLNTSSNLSEGNYDVSVTDATGMEIVTPFMIEQPDLLTAEMIPLPGCGATGGSTQVNVTGGSFPYSYAWSTGVTTPTATGLSTGIYGVTITDFNGCTAMSSTFLNQPIEVNSTPLPMSTSCQGANDGFVEISVWGGTAPLSYTWSNGDTTQNTYGLTEGFYSVTVTDIFGCSSISQATVEGATPITINVQGINHVDCHGGNNGAIFANAFGGNPAPGSEYIYNWSTGASSTFIDNLSAGTYTVTITDASQCTGVGTVQIVEPAPIGTFLFGSSVCNGSNDGTASVTATEGTPPFTYAWSNGESTLEIENLIPGTYTVTVTDFSQCTTVDSINVTLSNTIFASNAASTMITCVGQNDGMVSVAPTGGVFPYTYSWSTGSADSVLTGLAAGTYTVVVNDLFNCSFTETFNIVEPSAIQANETISAGTCTNPNGSIFLNPSGGNGPYTYLWFDGSTNDSLTNLTGGTYNVNIHDANNCVTQFAITVPSGSAPPTAIAQDVTISLDAIGFATVSPDEVNNGSFGDCGISSIFLDNTGFGCSQVGANTVTLTVVDANNETSTATAIITVLDELPPSILTQDITVYLDNTGSVNITPAQIDNGSADNCGIDSMFLSFDQFSCSSLGANTITLAMIDIHGNMNTGTATVTVADTLAPVASTQDVTVYLDANGMATLTPAQIDNGSSDNCEIDSIAVSMAQFDCSQIGTHNITLTVADATGNSSINSAMVTVLDTIAPSFSCPNDIALFACDASSILVDYVLPVATDNCDMVGAPVIVSGPAPGDTMMVGLTTVVYEVTDSSGNVGTCSFNITLTQSNIIVQVDSVFQATAGNDDGSISITVSSGTAPYMYEWISNGVLVSTDEDPTGLPAGNYEVVVTDANGCVTTFTVDVSTGIQDPELVSQVQVYPNPTTDNIFVNMDLPIQSGNTIQVYSISGKLLLEKTLNVGQQQLELNLSDFSNGVYLLQLTVNEGVVTKRITVQK